MTWSFVKKTQFIISFSTLTWNSLPPNDPLDTTTRKNKLEVILYRINFNRSNCVIKVSWSPKNHLISYPFFYMLTVSLVIQFVYASNIFINIQSLVIKDYSLNEEHWLLFVFTKILRRFSKVNNICMTVNPFYHILYVTRMHEGVQRS